MFKRCSLLLQLIFVIAISIFFGKYFSVGIIRAAYTFSVLFKDFLGLILPFILFAYLTCGILTFKKKAPLVLAIMIGLITLSNAAVALASYIFGRLTLPFIVNGIEFNFKAILHPIIPFIEFPIPSLIRSEQMLLVAIVISIFLIFYPIPKIERAFEKFKNIIEKILKYFIIPALPLYVLGFLLKINYEGTLYSLLDDYGRAFIVIICFQLIYLAIFYFAVNGFDLKRTINSIKNALPSYLTAFSTMSSTATIPVTVEGAIKNTSNKPLAHLAIPIMANVHLLGDCISTPILALVTMSLFLGIIPGIVQYLIFVFYFCITMLAVSGVPGGGIIVMIPVLQSILGFTPEMISVITTLYILQDCIGTAGNVMGDGALVILLNKILKKIGIVA